ncbi:MAG: Smr/MutS family protein [Deltaproteobacteria bacterium]|nr:Smr/MutS family protein [Deltaproteobacteria bacterium]
MRGTLADVATLENLEFGRVVESVARRAASSQGRILAAALAPDAGSERRERRRGLAMEMALLLGLNAVDRGPRLPVDFDLSFLDDPDPLLDRLERGGVLEGEDILRVVALVPPALAVHRLVGGREGRFAFLAALVHEHGLRREADAARLGELDLEAAAVLDDDGSVKDAASPELRKLRRKARDLRSRLSARAKRLVERHGAHLQDAFFTQRDDRYVLPVRSDSRAGVRGIIHGTSNSGATLFIEPDVLVDDCNDLKVLEGEALVCERAILQSLSADLAGQVPAFRLVAAMLARLDLACAIARFCSDAGASFARLSDEPVLDLRSVRHPQLELAGGRVVTNDVELSAGSGWVVSGPNAGGKTVLLKSVGLAVLMTYAGLPVTVDPSSIVGTFDHVRVEIGDAQSVEGNLSTFSAQVSSLAAILDNTGPRSLLLLDELAAGTDPDEGAALAEALVAEILERGAAVILATHFEPLKRLSISSDRLVAAGMGFDLEALEPTFKLHVGMPGTSGGLLVAERFGLPRSVVSRARAILEGGHGPEHGRLVVLERLREDLERRLGEAEDLEERLRSREVQLESREMELMESQRRRMRTEERYLATELTVLRSELKHAHKVLRRRPVAEPAVESSEKLASRVSRVLAPEGSVSRLARPPRPTESLGPGPLVAGESVYVPRLDLDGVVESVDGDRVRIRRGAIAWTVALADVARATREPDEPAGGQSMEQNRNPPSGGDEDESLQTAYNTLDLRGQGLDEAQIDLDAFIDQAIEMGIEEVFVIHGHGKGVLKNGLRRYLRHLKKVVSFRPGKRGEGGDGVTVCMLRGG